MRFAVMHVWEPPTVCITQTRTLISPSPNPLLHLRAGEPEVRTEHEPATIKHLPDGAEGRYLMEGKLYYDDALPLPDLVEPPQAIAERQSEKTNLPLPHGRMARLSAVPTFCYPNTQV